MSKITTPQASRRQKAIFTYAAATSIRQSKLSWYIIYI